MSMSSEERRRRMHKAVGSSGKEGAARRTARFSSELFQSIEDLQSQKDEGEIPDAFDSAEIPERNKRRETADSFDMTGSRRQAGYAE